MNDRYYHEQELLESAYASGVAYRKQGKPAKPLTYLTNVAQYSAAYRTEECYQKIIEWYRAGYDGLVLQEAIWKNPAEKEKV